MARPAQNCVVERPRSGGVRDTCRHIRRDVPTHALGPVQSPRAPRLRLPQTGVVVKRAKERVLGGLHLRRETKKISKAVSASKEGGYSVTMMAASVSPWNQPRLSPVFSKQLSMKGT
jgi:hypothetical protein